MRITRPGFWPSVFALAGVALFTGTMAWLGWGDVWHVLRTVNPAFFGAYFGAQLLTVAGLAGAWRLLLRDARGGRLLLLYWGRLVRDAAGEFLPFSHVGGFILGGRAIALGGVGFADATASTLADVTVEFLAELVFIGIGLLILLSIAPGSELLLPVAGGLAAATLGALGFLAAQNRGARIFRALALRIAGRAGGDAALKADQLQAAIDAIYADKRRLIAAAMLHLLCWFGTGLASFIGFRAVGVAITLGHAVAIESLLHAILAAGFFVPGRLGVQEAAYTLLGSVFGIPGDVALSVSLLRRARGLILAVPVLLVWQGIEAKRLQPASTPSE